MPTYQELLNSVKDGQQAQVLRLSLIQSIEEETGHPLIVYAAAIAGKHPMAPVHIDVTDKTAFSDLIEGIQGDSLDVFLHSSGGSAEAVEQIISLLRARFKELRFIVPHTATSAATLMVLAGDTVASALSKSLAEEWLRTYMLEDNPNASELAFHIANELSEHSKFLSHQRPIGIKKAIDLGLNVTDLATLPKLRDLVWELYCTIELHFGKSNAVKLFENSRGISYQRNFIVQQVGIQLPIAPIPGQPSPPAIPPQE
jgi:hypothetical protein